MRPATRWASNTSSASIFSPAPRNLIGRPVTWRMESAAPPRLSPSVRVRTRPVSGSRSWKALAVFTASWPVRAVGHQQGFGGLGDGGRSRPPRPSSARPAWCGRRCPGSPRRSRRAWRRIQRAARDVRRGLAGHDRQGLDPGLACRGTASCSIAAGRRVSSEAIRTLRRSVLVMRTRQLGRWWWSCPSPAGRPS